MRRTLAAAALALAAVAAPASAGPDPLQIVKDTLAVEETLFALDARLSRERELLAEHRHALIAAAVAGSAQTDEVAQA